MGKLLLALGVILIIVGIVGSVWSFVAPMQTVISEAVTEPTAAELCNPGEKLETARGSSQYTPGQGYARSVTYTCVNDAGVRRDVTGDFANGLMGQIGGLFGSIGLGVVFMALSCLGGVLMVAGIIVMVTRRVTVRTQVG